jgi:UDP-GlcNAc:undecaprenyl-phosphate/decaprenyl-phosphate GlcNAc-1-phosphate transferase
MYYILALVISLVSCVVILKFVLLVSHKNEWYDSTNERKVHTGNIPRLGGIGIFYSFLISLLIISFFLDDSMDKTVWNRQYAPVIICFLGIHFLGLIDDFNNIRARIKLVFQILASAIILIAGFWFRNILIPFDPFRIELGAVSYFITFFWLIGTTNAINLIDGIDGFAGGVSAIIALSFGVFFIVRNDIVAAIIAFAFIGALLGFLVFNFPPAKIFMGDSGSLFLGFFLGVLPILDSGKQLLSMNIISSITLMGIPILDVLSAVIRRRRKKVSFMAPDKEHIHHKLLSISLSPRKTLFILYGLQLVLSVCALSNLYFIEGAFYINLLAWIIAVGFFVSVHRIWEKKARTTTEMN